MYIVQKKANEYGARAPMQTWSKNTLPDGYVWCPDAFYDVFYSTTPAGFVHIIVEGDTVTAMTVNHEAYNVYVADHPVEPMPEAEPTADDILDALLGVTVNE